MKFVVVPLACLLFACSKEVPVPDASELPPEARPQAAGDVPPTMPSMPALDPADYPELKIETIKEGTGEKTLQPGMRAKFHYVGMLVSGEPFESSRFPVDGRTSPALETVVQRGTLIDGWVLGLQGMKPGERRRIYVPAALGYGEHGSPPKIPGNAPLIFDVELLELLDGS